MDQTSLGDDPPTVKGPTSAKARTSAKSTATATATATAGSDPRPDDLADRVALAVRAVPGVADLHTGAFGEVATHLPGRRVEGVRIRTDHCAVHLVVHWGWPVLQTADLVRRAIAPLVGTRVDVTIEDVVPELPKKDATSGG